MFGKRLCMGAAALATRIDFGAGYWLTIIDPTEEREECELESGLGKLRSMESLDFS